MLVRKILKQLKLQVEIGRITLIKCSFKKTEVKNKSTSFQNDHFMQTFPFTDTHTQNRCVFKKYQDLINGKDHSNAFKKVIHKGVIQSTSLSLSLSLSIYIYIYMCVCVCVVLVYIYIYI